MRVKQKALTFDDVLLVPAHSIVLPKDVSLVSRLTQNITLSIPHRLRSNGHRDGVAFSDRRGT